ncbi:MAG TPA: tricarballylate utilization 4Fe-4S protein TcuB [Candidatus Acidoferrales bacterium]|nr:tricarballylate utilization 4Fe-4S protein TcuB [Candidatus Acidoferrales bacterium]
MPGPEILNEAARQMQVCNACRYCEGYCAVFPAMELRRVFTKADLTYLANLCFDCRDCYYACQYAPPHEFAINIPKIMAELRADTYREFSWPAILSGLFRKSGWTGAAVTVAALVALFAIALVFAGAESLFATHLGAGAFYRVIPYAVMTLPFLVVAAYGAAVLAAGAFRFWRETQGGFAAVIDPSALWRATADAFGLAYLKGGGAGCNYPDAAFSRSRWWLHHLVFYGFLLDLASTTTAAFYHHFLGWEAPYPLLSWPVVLGTVGGVGLVIGSAGMLYLKWKSDRDPAARSMLTMDVAFLALLLLTSLSGLLLLAFRETGAMGTLLVIHLGMVAGLFITAPYGKFAHVVYRYAALVRYATERHRAAPGA